MCRLGHGGHFHAYVAAPGKGWIFQSQYNPSTPTVYQRPFRLVQELAFGTSQGARTALAASDTFTIRGVLEYQACDDTICYVPNSVPVAYTIKIRSLDTERANVPR